MEMEVDQMSVVELAKQKKNEGNSYYGDGDYNTALNLYTEAIDLDSGCAAYYGNRAATFIMLEKYQQALEDCRHALRIHPEFVKAHFREAKCHLALGDANAAVRCLTKVKELEPNNKAVLPELQAAKAVQQWKTEAVKSYDQQDFRKVVFCMGKAIELAPACAAFKVSRAEALVLLERFADAQSAITDVIIQDRMNADALYVRGLCFYYQDWSDKATAHFQQALRVDPEHSKCKQFIRQSKALNAKKEEGNSFFKIGDYQRACQLYTEALEIDLFNRLTNAKLYCNRGTALAKLEKYDEAIEDYTRAIELDETYLKAYQRRAKSYTDAERYDEAVRDYEKIFQMDRTRENRQLLQDAKHRLKLSKRKDYYKILGIGKTASDDEIKKAYRKLAMSHHPDRHAHASEEERKENEIQFKEVGEAYSILSDQMKRSRYDNGQDLEDSGMDFDASTLFSQMFGGFGYGGFGGGFPGGSSFQFTFG